MGRKGTRPPKKAEPIKSAVPKAAAPQLPDSGSSQLQCLTQQEALTKLDRVSVFNIVVEKPGGRDVFVPQGGTLDFFADADDARAALAAAREANPTLPLELEAAPLGRAFSIVQGLFGIRAPMRSALHFSKAVVDDVGYAGVPEAAREKMASAGPWPLFTTDAVRSPGAIPIFLSREELNACWAKSGRSLDSLPPLEECATDLRILIASTLSVADNWQPLLFLPPKSTTLLEKELAQKRERQEQVMLNMQRAKAIVDAEDASAQVHLKVHADDEPPALR